MTAAYDQYYILRASSGQERLWFLAQLDAGASVAYHLPAAIRIHGPLDRLCLQRSLNDVVRRQESLRTGLGFLDGAVCQLVLPDLSPVIAIIDATGLPVAELDALITNEVRRPFELDRPPLFRLTLVRSAADEHVLVMVLHHLIADGRSIEILLRELVGGYLALTAGRDLSDPAPEIQYADYAVWQREQLTDEVVATEVAHWRTRLTGVPPLNLPTDRPRPAVRSTAGRNIRRLLPAELLAAASAAAVRHRATLFMVLLAAYQATLYRLSGQEDFAVGTAVANRTMPETEGLIGLFANTVAIRADLAGNPTFAGLLERVRRASLDAYDHDALPFERLVDQLRPPRDLSTTPIFQTMFVLQEPTGPAAIADLVLGSALDIDLGTARFDLVLSATPGPGGLELAMEYSTDLFDEGTIDQLLDHFHAIVAAGTAHPTAKLADIGLVTEAIQVPIPAEVSAVDPVEAMLGGGSADAVAVVDSTGSVTYGQVRARVDELARRLGLSGVRRGDRVGVCVPRGVDLVAALLSTWRCGAAYVPLDPAHPDDHLAHIVDSAGAATVLTTEELAGRIARLGRRSVAVDGPVPVTAAGPPTIEPVQPVDGAYVIFTSGSTGRPKGVRVSHGNLAAFLSAIRDRIGLADGAVLAAVTSVSFDIAGLELFAPLTVGGRVCVATQETATDGERLATWLVSQSATVMQATPATWRLLLAAGWRPPAGFRILCGGEALDAELAGRLVGTGAEVWNLYGPTEATVWACAERVRDPDRVRLGPPLAGAGCYLLDGSLRPVARGGQGEIYLGGELVASGYINTGGLTGARFLPDPFAGRPGARMYRTGDLARYAADGGLRFLGRTDEQIKVRGYRIEPVEVEAALATRAGVRHVAVVAHQYGPDDVRLTAHVVPDASGVEPSDLVARLRAHAIRTLPAHAVPGAFCVREALPLNTAGKVDRAALRRAPVPATSPVDAAPRDETEKTVAATFCDILGISAIGVGTSFFEAGGHSLLAAKLVAQLRTEFGVLLPVRALFETPTVAGIATAISTSKQDQRERDRRRVREQVDNIPDDQLVHLLRQLAPHWFGDGAAR